jgi:hypothetical protein
MPTRGDASAERTFLFGTALAFADSAIAQSSRVDTYTTK